MPELRNSSAYQLNAIALPLAIVGALVSALGVYLLYPPSVGVPLAVACLVLAGLFAALRRFVLPRLRTSGQLDAMVLGYHGGMFLVLCFSLALSPETDSPGIALLICAFSGLLFKSTAVFAGTVVIGAASWLGLRISMGAPLTPSIVMGFLVIMPVFSAMIRLSVLKTHRALDDARVRESKNVVELKLAAEKLAKEAQLRRESELKFLHAQKNESLGVLAAGVAHDFNNSLLAISAFAENVQLTTDDEATRAASTQILTAVSQASRICGLMLTYAGKTTQELKSLSLPKLVKEAQPLLQAAVGTMVTVKVKCQAGLGSITANETQIQQILMNLVTNAAEATNEKGIVTVNVTKVAFEEDLSDVPDGFFGSPIRSGTYVQLEVIDRGIGMPKDILLQMFDPYFTTKQSGHGFGLSIVLGIVRSHKATMSVNSQPDKGTKVQLLFPSEGMKFADSSQFRIPRGPGALSQQSTLDRDIEFKKRILIVDDDELVRTPLSRMLNLLKWEVVDVASGVEAIDLIRSGEVFSALLIDFKMPQLNGKQTLKAIRELGCQAPAILCSGFISEPEQAAVLAEFDDFLPKPFHRRELEIKLARLQKNSRRTAD